jgi:uncharacterized protein Smg (DUF494 family)
MTDRYTVERIMEIITYVMGAREPGTPLTSVDTTELYAQGYTDSEIAAALSWIIERGEQTLEVDAGDVGPDSFRILHGLETEAITSEAWGLLLSYRNLGFLSNEDVEQIIERAMLMAGETIIDVVEIRAIVAVYVTHLDNYSTGGNRSLLSGNESVN